MAPKNIQKLIDKADQALYTTYDEIKKAQDIHDEAIKVISGSDYDGNHNDLSEVLDGARMLGGLSAILAILLDPEYFLDEDGSE